MACVDDPTVARPCYLALEKFVDSQFKKVDWRGVDEGACIENIVSIVGPILRMEEEVKKPYYGCLEPSYLEAAILMKSMLLKKAIIERCVKIATHV
jgi:hypothetical protein